MKSKYIAEGAFLDSLLGEIQYDLDYISSNSHLCSNSKVLDNYVHGSCVRFRAIASYLWDNNFIDTDEYRLMKRNINDYMSEAKALVLACDIEGASSDPEFMFNVKKAVEKYGTIN